MTSKESPLLQAIRHKRQPENPPADLTAEDEVFQWLNRPQEPESRWLFVIGRIFRAIVYVAAIAIAGWNINFNGETPLGSMTLNDLFRPILLAGGALLGIKWLFDGTSDEAARVWGGVALLVTVAIAAIFVISFYMYGKL